MTARPPRRPTVRRSYATRIDEPTLLQFVVLSMLVHILAIVLFGATGRGGAGKASELLGALDVILQRVAPATGFRVAPEPAETASSARPLRPAPETRPEASPSTKGREGETVRPSLESRRPATSPIETPTPAPEEYVPRLNRSAPEEVDKPLRPESPAAPIAPPAIERQLAPAIEAPSRAIPSAPAAPIERIAPPTLERALTRPPELPSQAVPVVPSAPLERLTPPRSEPELPAPLEALKELPLAPGAPIERPVAPAIERELAQPVDVPTRALPAAPATSIERVTPPTSDRQLAPAAEVPLRSHAPVQTPAAPVPTPASAPARAPAAEPAPPGATSAQPPARAPAGQPIEREAAHPAPSAPAVPRSITPGSIFDRTPGTEASPPARLGVPSPEEEIFKPRTDKPGDAAPRIDLDAAKKRVVREVGSGSTGVLPFPLPVPEKKTKEANAMEKAIKPDCRTHYAGMGLFAVPFLVAAAVSDDAGCRW